MMLIFPIDTLLIIWYFWIFIKSWTSYIPEKTSYAIFGLLPGMPQTILNSLSCTQTGYVIFIDLHSSLLVASVKVHDLFASSLIDYRLNNLLQPCLYPFLPAVATKMRHEIMVSSLEMTILRLETIILCRNIWFLSPICAFSVRKVIISLHIQIHKK